MKVNELKAALEERGLDTKGLKKDLAARLLEALVTPPPEAKGSGEVVKEPAATEAVSEEPAEPATETAGEVAEVAMEPTGAPPAEEAEAEGDASPAAGEEDKTPAAAAEVVGGAAPLAERSESAEASPAGIEGLRGEVTRLRQQHHELNTLVSQWHRGEWKMPHPRPLWKTAPMASTGFCRTRSTAFAPARPSKTCQVPQRHAAAAAAAAAAADDAATRLRVPAARVRRPAARAAAGASAAADEPVDGAFHARRCAARAMSPPPSPPHTRASPSGHTYYYNAMTGASSWERPPDYMGGAPVYPANPCSRHRSVHPPYSIQLERKLALQAPRPKAPVRMHCSSAAKSLYQLPPCDPRGICVHRKARRRRWRRRRHQAERPAGRESLCGPQDAPVNPARTVTLPP